jgi:hypothetical protein
MDKRLVTANGLGYLRCRSSIKTFFKKKAFRHPEDALFDILISFHSANIAFLIVIVYICSTNGII